LLEGLEREYIYLVCVLRTLMRMRGLRPGGTRTIVDIVEGFAKKTPTAPAVIAQDKTFSYRELDDYANRIARWALAQGVRRGETVILFMENRPEFIATWLGILKLGAVAALVNSNLKGSALVHSIAIAKARLAIVGEELCETYAEAEAHLDPKPEAWASGGAGFRDLDTALAAQSPELLDKSMRKGLRCKDNALFIYTSGTTGLPKAANFSHMRMLYMMHGFAGGLGTGPKDRIYCPLPLYHATGGICAVGMALTSGGAVIVKRKFSASEFWEDCRKFHATIFQYIGEMCRYLLNAPVGPHERDHTIRAISGNGLRPEIWARFQERFAIPRIVEFYGATEGNVSMLNYDGHLGAVGRVPRYMRVAFPFRLVRFDIAAEMPVRGNDGRCIECEAGEAGEALGEISARPGRSFEGYTRAADTEKKILRDVFRKGDAWFRTGDLLRRDEHDYFYFVDRIGDTFRWKGENVSTGEVSEALGVVPGILEVNVYGVAIPGIEGRAGMAALVAERGFNPAGLGEKLGSQLASYARPVFLRLRPEMEITGTFKLKKVDLVREGCDPQKVDDPLYWFDPRKGRYAPLTHAVYADIAAGRVKL
jgi:fatty-acyl-CoA synthase